MITAPSSLAHWFESIKHIIDGMEFWYARELYPILGYTNREKFQAVIQKAKDSIKSAWWVASDHFHPEVKLIQLPKWAQREIDDILLTRLACYQIAMNGNVRKVEIATAQLYFATQTRKQELYQEYLYDKQRYEERLKYTETDKEVSKKMFDKGLSWPQIAAVKAKGQEAFYNNTTEYIRKKYGIDKKIPIVNKAPQILITAQSLANQMTALNIDDSNLNSEAKISYEHHTNNKAIRNTLIKRWIVPEKLPPEENTDHLPKKLKSFEAWLDKDILPIT